jgi:GT2 family glycosyltransferase
LTVYVVTSVRYTRRAFFISEFGSNPDIHMTERSVDLMYLAWNRFEFTRRTFRTLLDNTDWEFVHELFVYDDGSTDGTREWLQTESRNCPAAVRWFGNRFGSPVTAMRHFIEHATAPMLAKTDNDAMLPSGWLQQSLGVFDRHPELHLLGIEAMYPHEADPACQRTYEPAKFISGLGLYRRAAFARSRPREIRKWFGLEEWQVAQGLGLRRGWIRPALPVFLLDRLPLEPWRGFSDRYIAQGWQRRWPKYDPTCSLWQWAQPELTSAEPQPNPPPANGNHLTPTPAFKVVILSARASNLVPCVKAILENEPNLPPDHVIVVDDGARAEAEAQLPGVTWIPGSKPFNFARNASLGIAAAQTDVILLNDDARLLTSGGFTALARIAQENPRVAICSAGVRGLIGNPRQAARVPVALREETQSLAFVCVHIGREIFARLGPLDERFAGYGFEDNDYCARARAAGFRLTIWDGCVVDHSGHLPSTFRSRPDLMGLFRTNQRLFQQKWGRAR